MFNESEPKTDFNTSIFNVSIINYEEYKRIFFIFGKLFFPQSTGGEGEKTRNCTKAETPSIAEMVVVYIEERTR